MDVLDSAGGVDTDIVDSIEGGSLRTIPVEADLLLAYSVVPGNNARRFQSFSNQLLK